jgi:hypothetical protein
MSNLLLPHNNWWETNTFGSSTLPFGFSAPQDSYLNNGWEDLDGDLKMFLAIEELASDRREKELLGTRKAGLGSACSEIAT